VAPPSEWRNKWRHLGNDQTTITNKSKLKKNWKFPNIRRTQWRPLANVGLMLLRTVVMCFFRCVSKISPPKTPSFFHGPATRITLNIHSKLNLHLQINCSSAFKHLSLLFLICKNNRGPKRPPTNLLICTRGTLTEMTPPYNIPTKTTTNPDGK